MKCYGILLIYLLILPGITKGQEKDTLIRGVKASFAYSTTIFPESWQGAPISAKGESIANAEINRSKKVTIKALAKYPASLLSNDLKAIYWVRKMSFYDVGYGGTNSTDALYLTNDGINLGYTEKYLEQTFHHEFSSILYRNHPGQLDTTSWKTANSKDFNYNDPEDGVGAIRKNASSQDLDTFLCKRGMLTQYALSSMENDVNTFAQNIFCPSYGFWKMVDNYPRIRKKALLLISFYNKLNPLFTEQYFRKLETD
ncbi:MAG TPA: hypothetical protein VF487_05805 [Chitinophagaceae bacterium]